MSCQRNKYVKVYLTGHRPNDILFELINQSYVIDKVNIYANIHAYLI
jgi:hypothetical protein